MPSYHYNNGMLGTAPTPLLVADRALVVTSLIVCNTSGGNLTYDLRHVPADQTASDDHAIYHLQTIRTNVTAITETPLFLQPGDSLEAYASAGNAVATHLYYLDYESWISGGSR